MATNVAAPVGAAPASLATGIRNAAAVQTGGPYTSLAGAVTAAANAHPAAGAVQTGLLALLNHARAVNGLPTTVSGTGQSLAVPGLPAKVSGSVTLNPSLAATATAASSTDPYTAAVAQAQQLAQQQIDAQVSALRDQQTLAGQQAQQRADAINAASLGAAQFLSGLGDQTQSDYASALNSNTGLAQGYTGQLQTDAASQAAQVQSMLGSVSGNTQTATDKGGSLANLLYGLTGAIPGQALTVQGLGATAAARALPAASIGYGQQQALGALGAGQTAEDAITQQIAQAQGTLPQVEQGYASQLTSAAQNEQNLQLQQQSQANQVSQFNTTTKQNATENAATLAFQKSQAAGVAKQNAANLALSRAQFNHQKAVDSGNAVRANKAQADTESAQAAAAKVAAQNAANQQGYILHKETMDAINSGYDPKTGLPLTQSQLSVEKRIALSKPTFFKTGDGQEMAFNPLTATATPVGGLPPTKMVITHDSNGGIYSTNPVTGATTTQVAPTAKPPKLIVTHAGNGSIVVINSQTMRAQTLPDTAKPPKAAAGLTPSARSAAFREAISIGKNYLAKAPKTAKTAAGTTAPIPGSGKAQDPYDSVRVAYTNYWEALGLSPVDAVQMAVKTVAALPGYKIKAPPLLGGKTKVATRSVSVKSSGPLGVRASLPAG